jgi:hypothetical protein
VLGRRSNLAELRPRMGQNIHLIIVLSDAVRLLQVSSNSLSAITGFPQASLF